VSRGLGKVRREVFACPVTTRCRYCGAEIELYYAGQVQEGRSWYLRYRVDEHVCRKGWARVREPERFRTRSLGELVREN
jgi:hypothetical protein